MDFVGKCFEKCFKSRNTKVTIKKMDSNATTTATEIYPYSCPIAMQWTIDVKDLTFENGKSLENGKFLKTSTFKSRIPGVSYYLHFYPNGYLSSSVNFSAVYLYIDYDYDIISNVKAVFTVIIPSASLSIATTQDYSPKFHGWGLRICSLKDLMDPDKKFLTNGKLCIEVKAILKAQDIKISNFTIRSAFLSQIMENDQDKDIIINVQGKEIMAHKDILVHRSGMIKKIIDGAVENESPSTGRTSQKRRKICNTTISASSPIKIEINKFSYDIVKIVMDFCYDKNIDSVISEVNAADLFQFVLDYEMGFMKWYLEVILAKKLSDDNVVKLANLSIKVNSRCLREHCIYYLSTKEADQTIQIKDAKSLNPELRKNIIERVVRYVAETEKII